MVVFKSIWLEPKSGNRITDCFELNDDAFSDVLQEIIGEIIPYGERIDSIKKFYAFKGEMITKLNESTVTITGELHRTAIIRWLNKAMKDTTYIEFQKFECLISI